MIKPVRYIYASTTYFTLNDGQQDDDDEEEECDVKENSVHLVRVTVRWLDLITNTTPSSHSGVQVVHETLKYKHKRRPHSYYL